MNVTGNRNIPLAM